MISKLDYLSDLKKLKNLAELIIEDNPVLMLKESYEIVKLLPVKNKSCSTINTNSKNPKSSNSSLNKLHSSPIKSQIEIFNDNTVHKRQGFSNMIKGLPDISDNTLNVSYSEVNINANNNKDDICDVNPTNNINLESGGVSEADSDNIINHIEKEWRVEYTYIIDNGYNGYGPKRLKESKIVSGHAELEGNNKLNIYGNALEVLDQVEFSETIDHIQFEYFNIDLIANKKNIEKLKRFNKLNKLVFSNNNIHSFYQIVKFEDFNEIESMNIINNEITGSNLLKYFLIYRFQNLKSFNDIEISQKDLSAAKKLFEYFDKCISTSEARKDRDVNKNNGLEGSMETGSEVGKQNEIEMEKLKVSNKNVNMNMNINELEQKKKLYEYFRENLLEVMEELIDED